MPFMDRIRQTDGWMDGQIEGQRECEIENKGQTKKS